MSTQEIEQYIGTINALDVQQQKSQQQQKEYKQSASIADNYVSGKLPVNTSSDDGSRSPPSKKQRLSPLPVNENASGKKERRKMDWGSMPRRHVALKFCYFGEQYAGLAIQESIKTVESELIAGMIKTCLIPSMDLCNYTRCGRTDRGVSALTQVCTVDLRSLLPYEQHNGRETGLVPAYSSMEQYVRKMANLHNKVLPDELNEETIGMFMSEMTQHHTHDVVRPDAGEYNESEAQQYSVHDLLPGQEQMTEMDYVSILNSVQPDDIRVLAWAPVPAFYNARFDCDARAYKYLFYQDGMNQEKMDEAAKLQRGTHDFRNLCKMDVVQTRHFVRRVCDASVRVCSTDVQYNPSHHGVPLDYRHLDMVTDDALCEFTVVGQAFLYNQVRCMIAVLFLVGQGLEEPDVITRLFDLQEFSTKPVYPIASDAQLILWDASFPACQWRSSRAGLQKAFSALHAKWRQHRMRAYILETFWRSVIPTCIRLFDNQLQQQHQLDQWIPEQRYAPSLRDVLPANTDKPQLTVTPSFPAIPPSLLSVLRIHGFLGCQLVPGKASKKSHDATTQSIQGSARNPRGTTLPAQYLSHAPFTTHVAMNKRQREPSFEARVASLSGKKKDQLDKITAFNEKLVNNNIIKQVE